MITNVWDKISLYCLNHDEPVAMELLSNTELIKTPYMACTKASDEVPCPNRLNLDDYQGICLKVLEEIAYDLGHDFTNYEFFYKGNRHKLKVKVLSFSNKEIRIGILNLTVLGRTS